MPLTTKGTPYVVSTDLVANYPTVSSDLADHIDDNLQYNAQDINAQTGSGANAYTFVLADASLYKLVTASNAAAATYTVPPQSSVTWAAGAVLRILNQGAGVVTLAGGSGVTLNGAVLTLNQYQYAEIHRTASNTWTVIGIATPPGLVKITDSTFSAQSTVSVNNCFSSTYQNYAIYIRSIASTIDNINFRLRVGGTDASGTNYRLQDFTVSGATVSAARVLAAQFRITANDTTAPTGTQVLLFSPNEAARTSMISQSASGNNTSDIYAPACQHELATAYDGFSIIAGSGNMTGTVRVYGYRN